MVHVRRLEVNDVGAVVALVNQQLAHASALEPAINHVVDNALFDEALRAQRAHVWVAIRHGVLVGHLYGAVLANARGPSAWVGPDGVSFDAPDALDALYARAGQAWIDGGALEHWVWTPDRVDAFLPWSELGFAKEHRRGVRALTDLAPAPLPPGLELRPGHDHEWAVAEVLDAHLDAAQREGPNFFLSPALPSESITATLDDPDVDWHVLARGGEVLAQCVSYPLDPRRGSFDDVVHLSGVVVRDDVRRRGLGRILVEQVLAAHAARGARYAEVHWRVTNRDAERFWRRAGFVPTFTRLRRVIDA
ncbi:MAG: GNAT family N-acetyltransferase [Acidobacteriota bacterium]|nr:GNAT family N-acetyltransferase [Acidobacteriota bacterium]MDE3221926.1 GNAT family N-acetyltransferase [Acidobacteriota bacterium]